MLCTIYTYLNTLTLWNLIPGPKGYLAECQIKVTTDYVQSSLRGKSMADLKVIAYVVSDFLR